MNFKYLWWWILWLLAVLVMQFIWTYNSFIWIDEQLKSLEAQVNNMYDRRTDLVPQVAAVVKRYAEFEKWTLEWVTRLRSDSQNLQALQQMIWAWQTKSPEFWTLLWSTLSSLKVTVEAYPQLKADTQFSNLYATLEWSENRIRVSIKDFNDFVVNYNLKLRGFPMWLIFSKIMWYQPKERINPPVDKEIKKAPNVDALLEQDQPKTNTQTIPSTTSWSGN